MRFTPATRRVRAARTYRCADPSERPTADRPGAGHGPARPRIRRVEGLTHANSALQNLHRDGVGATGPRYHHVGYAARMQEPKEAHHVIAQTRRTLTRPRRRVYNGGRTPEPPRRRRRRETQRTHQNTGG